MTKANILRKYFKKFYNLDLSGMSLAEVLKQFMKAQYDFDSKGSGVVSIVQEMIDNNLAPEGGGGSGEVSSGVRFIDYDGTVLHTYSTGELTELPANPSHTGLVAQGWNWSLSEINEYIQAYPDSIVDVGQMYTTDDGSTRFYIYIDPSTPSNRRDMTLRFKSSEVDNVTIDWGDGTVETAISDLDGEVMPMYTDHTHMYAETGEYIIKLIVNSGTVKFGGDADPDNDIYSSICGEWTQGTAYKCSRLRKVEIGDNVESLGKFVFYNLNLTSVTIPSSVTSIGENAFNSCNSLTSITIPSSVTSIEENAFNSCNSLTSITIPSSVTSIGEYAFSDCVSLISVCIPSSVTSIGGNAFNHCSSLTSVTIPSSVTSIGEYAFCGYNSLTSVTIPSSVTSIEQGTFSGCDFLTSVTIPSSVTSIGEYTFSDCELLTSVTIPSSVTNIGDFAFGGCYSLFVCRLLGNDPPVIGSDVFAGDEVLTIYVPNGTGEVYKNQWGYEDIIIEDDETSGLN